MPNAYDATGRAGVPLELKVLGYLRVLGRGWYFDDVAESTGMSEETARVSFHHIAAEVAYGELGRLHLDMGCCAGRHKHEPVWFLPGCDLGELTGCSGFMTLPQSEPNQILL